MNEKDRKTTLKSAVLERIDCDKVCPKSRLIFQSKEAGVWFLWLASVLIGATAVAVSLFVIQSRQYALYEATHENFTTFMIEFLPYLWFVIFGAMIIVGMYNLRHTKHGYRYPIWQIVASSMVFSLAGGTALHLINFGYKTDHMLGQQMSMYRSQEKIDQQLWSNPEEGRLVGRKVLATVDSQDVIFEDITGDRWIVSTDDLRERDFNLLESESLVRMIGVIKSGEVKSFHSCGAFPWIKEGGPVMKEFKEIREEFKEHIIAIKQFDDKFEKNSSTTNENEDSPCASLPLVRRMEDFEDD